MILCHEQPFPHRNYGMDASVQYRSGFVIFVLSVLSVHVFQYVVTETILPPLADAGGFMCQRSQLRWHSKPLSFLSALDWRMSYDN